MSKPPPEPLETRLEAAARAFSYPPTPDVAGSVTRRLASAQRRRASPQRLAWVAASLIILFGTLAVPRVRAAVLEFLEIGRIRIILSQPTATTTMPPTSTVELSTAGAEQPPVGVNPPGGPLVSVLDLTGEATLADATRRAGFPLRLPAYPPDLGPPDRVFVQDANGTVVILVWLVPGSQEQVHLSLYQLGAGAFADKLQPEVIEETTVGGQRALWVEGAHFLQFRDERGRVRYGRHRLVEGHVLIWAEGEITYRLESDLPLEEAVRIAESMQ